MRRFLPLLLLVLALPCVQVAFAQEDIDLSPDEYRAEKAQLVREYIASAGDTVGISCYRADQPALGVRLRDAEQYPLASTIKIMILGVYAQGAATGRFDPTERIPLDELDAYYLPGTDRGSHPTFLENVQPDSDDTITLLDVVYGMIRYSSNAASDFLLARMTDADFEAFYALMSVQNTELPVSFLGLFLAQDNHETGIADTSMERDELRASAADWAARYVEDEDWRSSERQYHRNNSRRYLAQGLQIIPTQQAFFEKYDTRGTPADFAHVMATLIRGETLSATAGAVMRAVLSWPMQFERNRENFYTVGLKGGSLPGILTGVYFAQPKGGQPLALVIFYHDLPQAQYSEWLRSYEQQELEFHVLLNGCGILEGLDTLPPMAPGP